MGKKNKDKQEPASRQEYRMVSDDLDEAKKILSRAYTQSILMESDEDRRIELCDTYARDNRDLRRRVDDLVSARDNFREYYNEKKTQNEALESKLITSWWMGFIIGAVAGVIAGGVGLQALLEHLTK